MNPDLYNRTYYGDSLTILPQLIEAGIKVNMCVTSPPYWGLRQYLFDNAVMLRQNLTQEETDYVLKELEKHGIKPHT